MLVIIFEDKNEQAIGEALQLDWTYANKITKSTYEEVTEALDKFS